jgi:hypothetical protein
MSDLTKTFQSEIAIEYLKLKKNYINPVENHQVPPNIEVNRCICII